MMKQFGCRSAACLWLVCAAALAACGDDDDAPASEESGSSSSGAQHGSSSSGQSTSHQAGDNDAGAGADESTRVTIEDGDIEGSLVADDKVRAFLGIPYAKPPVGELRFKRPERPAAWTTPRKATEYGGRCAQPESSVLMNAASDNEDCLYLNVWAPAAPTKRKLPVMFWIHGGGNVNGSASEPVPYVNSGYFYSGEHLAAEHDVVVVSINYRLGVFGFLAEPGLADDGKASGNQGLWDQQFALEWVKRNIASFGGDPAQVTIFGESAGSLDVCFHVASPASRNLFSAAISESGGCTTYQTPQKDGESKTTALAKKLGCSGDDVMDCLRSKSVSDVLTAGSTGFGPVVDGEFLPDQPRALFDRGEIARVPYILGSNTDEGTLFTLGNNNVDSEETLKAAIESNFSASADEVLKHYPLSDFADQPKPYLAAFSRILGDAALVCSTYDVAVRNADAGADTYMYNFDIPANVPGLGATHGSELVYVFGTSPSFDDAEKQASQHIQTYWTNFAATGDPNGHDLPDWPRFTAKSNQRVNLALEITQVSDFRAAECEFWRGVYDAGFKSTN